MEKNFRLFFFKKCRGKISLCCDRSVKSLAWAVDGCASAIKNGSQHVRQYKTLLNMLAKDYSNDDIIKKRRDVFIQVSLLVNEQEKEL